MLDVEFVALVVQDAWKSKFQHSTGINYSLEFEILGFSAFLTHRFLSGHSVASYRTKVPRSAKLTSFCAAAPKSNLSIYERCF